MQGDGQVGQPVRPVGNDLFFGHTDPEVCAFGILIKDYAAGEMPGIYCNGGNYGTNYGTNVFEGAIAAGDELKVSASGKLTAGDIGTKRRLEISPQATR